MIDGTYNEAQLDLMPKDWKLVTLGEIISNNTLWVKNGYAQGGYNQDGLGIPQLRPFNITSQGSIDFSLIKYVEPPPKESQYWVNPADVIFNNTNSEELVGKTAYFSLNGKFVLSNHMTIMRVLDQNSLDSYWLAHVMYYFWHTGLFKAICRRHVNQASISLAHINGITIPLPPLPEQRAIAQVLSTVRQSIEATKQVIAAARELKRSLMKYLFTYGPVPIDQADQVVLKETSIGPVPEEWEVDILGNFIRQTQYGSNLRAEKNGMYPILRMNNLKDGIIDKFDLKYVDLDRQTFQNFQLEEGDLLFNRTNSYELVGKTSIFELKGEFIFASYIVKIQTDDEVLKPKYLNFYMNWEKTQERLKSLATRGVSQSNISATKLRSFTIKVPSIKEQIRISEMLDHIEQKIDYEVQRVSALESLFNSLLYNLMTGKVRINQLTGFNEQEETL